MTRRRVVKGGANERPLKFDKRLNMWYTAQWVDGVVLPVPSEVFNVGDSYREELKRRKKGDRRGAREVGPETTAKAAARRAFWSKTTQSREKARQAALRQLRLG